MGLTCTVAGTYAVRIGVLAAAQAEASIHDEHWCRAPDRPPRTGQADYWLPHMPLRLVVTPNSLSSKCTLVWPPPPSIAVGDCLVLRLRVTDPWGNPISSVGGAVALLERLREDGTDYGAADWVQCESELQQGRFASMGHEVDHASPGSTDVAGTSGCELVLRAWPRLVGLYVPLVTIVCSRGVERARAPVARGMSVPFSSVHGLPTRHAELCTARPTRHRKDGRFALQSHHIRLSCGAASPLRIVRMRVARLCAAGRWGAWRTSLWLCATLMAIYYGIARMRYRRRCLV